ncbi:hypothetical protein NHQ30_001654 [Ciborinia camelliae]|nr:hypothetical protein NHQ30_001654 [Ciborinia camelliae]
MHLNEIFRGKLVPWLLAVLSVSPAFAMPGAPIPTPGPSRLTIEKRSISISFASDQCKTPLPNLPNLCTAEISLPPYTPAYTAGTSLTSASSSAPTGPPICENQADPDNDGPDYCYCSQGTLTTQVAPVTGSGGPCPWTALPITGAGPKPTFTPPPGTNTALYSYTAGYDVIACQSSIVSMTNNVEVTSCKGLTYTISELPHATVQVGSSTQNVGTLSSAALYTAVSNALTSVCPPPSAGSSTYCTASATITGVSYTFNETVAEYKKRDTGGVFGNIDSAKANVARREETSHIEKRLDIPLPINEKVTVIKSDGELVISVPTSNYTSQGILNSMIVLAASTFASSASGKACATFLNRKADGIATRDTAPSTLLCGATHFAGVEYTNWALDSGEPAAYLGVELDFQQGMSELLDMVFECEELVNGILEIVGTIFPEIAPLELDSEEFVAAGCEAAMQIGQAIKGS